MAAMNRTSWQLGIVSAAALTLAACGGGGGDDSSADGDGLDPTQTSAVEIDDSNADTLGSGAASGARSIGDLAASQTQGQLIGGVVLEGSDGSELSTGAATQLAIEKALELAGREPFAVSGVKTSVNCPNGGSGSITETGTQNDQLDPGDTWTATWDTCTSSFKSPQGFTTTIVLDGTIEFMVDSCTGCADIGDESVDWKYQVSITYTDWSLEITQGGTSSADLVIDGAFTFGADNDASAQQTTFTADAGPWEFRNEITGEGFGFANLDVEYVEDRGAGTYTVTVNAMDFVSSAANGKVTAATTTPLSGSTGQPPTSGVLEISGANGTSAMIDAGACSDTEYNLTVNNQDKGCQSWTS